VLFFEITSFRYVPLAVVMFSLPYQFCRRKILLRSVFGLSQSDAFSSGCVWWGGGQAFFPPRFFLLRDSVTVFVRDSPTVPNSSHAKEERHVLKNQNQKSREWENDKSLGLCYWNILTVLGSLTFYYRR